jgi:hypothetical protein
VRVCVVIGVRGGSVVDVGGAASFKLLGVALIAVLGSALALTVVVREVACGVGVEVEFG